MPDQMQQSRWALGGQERGEGLREADARHGRGRAHNARGGIALDGPTTGNCSCWQRCGGLLEKK